MGELAVYTRPVLLTAVIAALGLAALGTVVAQQPPPTPPNSGPGPGTLPATTVRPYSEWTPTPPAPGYVPNQPATGVQQAGAYLPLPPGYNAQPPVGQPPVGQPGTAQPRLTQPAVAGVIPAGGVTIPPPNMDLSSVRPAAGVVAPPSSGMPAPGSTPPSNSTYDPSGSKFAPTPFLPTAPTSVPPVPSAVTPQAPSSVVPLPPPATIAPPPPTGATGVLPPTLPASPPSVPPPQSITVPPAAPATATTVPVLPTPGTPAPVVATPPAVSSPGAVPVALPGRVAPSVVIEAVCPESVVFGQELQYKLIVRNTGTSSVAYVRVEDELPAGARYVGSDPVAETNGDRLVWVIGTLDVGAEKQITVRVKPGDEGDARSRATVSFATAVDARSRVTRPRLAAVVSGTDICRAGEETTFQIKVTNSGSGPATRLLLKAQLSDGLLHSQGVLIEAELPTILPGESKAIPLKVAAAKSGMQWCQVVVAADGSQDATAKTSVTVVEPMLTVKQTGPAKCLVRAEPTYIIEMCNPGTAATDPVLLQTILPDGFDYVQASDGGSVVTGGRTVAWRLPSLAQGGSRSVTLKLRAVAAVEGGLLRTKAEASPSNLTSVGAMAGQGGVSVRPSGRGLVAQTDMPVTAEGVAAVHFEVVGLDNPVPVGREASYEIRVTNQGTGPCSNVQITAIMADGTEFAGATGGTNPTAGVKPQGQQLTFDAIPVLGVRGETVYRVKIRGSAPGDLRFRVQLTCDQLKTPIVKEESTTFYKE